MHKEYEIAQGRWEKKLTGREIRLQGVYICFTFKLHIFFLLLSSGRKVLNGAQLLDSQNLSTLFSRSADGRHNCKRLHYSKTQRNARSRQLNYLF